MKLPRVLQVVVDLHRIVYIGFIENFSRMVNNGLFTAIGAILRNTRK